MFYSMYAWGARALSHSPTPLSLSLSRTQRAQIAWTWGSPLKRANMRFKINCQKKTDFTPSDFTAAVLCVSVYRASYTLLGCSAYCTRCVYAICTLAARWAYA